MKYISLTTEDKIKAYQFAKERVLRGGTFICYELSVWVEDNKDVQYFSYLDVEFHFPELNEFEPEVHAKDAGGGWFGSNKKGDAKRIAVLDEILNHLTKTEVKNNFMNRTV